MPDSSTNPIPYPNHRGVSGIYEIVCTANGKRYIGSAKNLMHRRNDHRSDLRRNIHRNIHLQRAWNLYGEDSFEWRVLELCGENYLLEREQFYIDMLHPELNISPVAGSPMKGRHHKPSVIEGIANKLRGRPHSAEHKRKIGEAHRGKPRSEETKRKLSEFFTGTKHTSEAKAKMSKYWRERVLLTGNIPPNAKLTEEKVIELRKLYADGVSVKDLSRMFGLNLDNTRRVALRKSWKHIP